MAAHRERCKRGYQSDGPSAVNQPADPPARNSALAPRAGLFTSGAPSAGRRPALAGKSKRQSLTRKADMEAQNDGAVGRRDTGATLSLSARASYGVGAAVDGFTLTSLSTFQLFYLTAVCGLSNTLAGASISLTLCVDALADPLFGSLSDNGRGRLGRRHPFMFGAILPLALAFGLLFSVPTGLKGWSLFVYVTLASIALRVAHSAFNLPYVALGMELSADYAERTKVAASRFLFNVLASLGCLVLGQGVFLHGPNGLLDRAGYSSFGWACGAVAATAGLFCAFATLGLRRLSPTGASATTQGLVGQASGAIEIFRNPSFVSLFLSTLLVSTGIGVALALSLHVNRFFWELPSQVVLYVLLASPIGILAGSVATVLATRILEKRFVAIAGLMIIALSQFTLPVLKVVHLLPTSGWGLYAILIGNAFVATGAAVGCVGITTQSILADAVDQHEYLFGTRREGLYFAGLNFAGKAAVGLGALIAGAALDVIGLPPDIASSVASGVRLPPETVRILGLVQGPGVAIMTVIATGIFLHLRLDRAAHGRIQAELAQGRRAAARLPDAGRGDSREPYWSAQSGKSVRESERF